MTTGPKAKNGRAGAAPAPAPAKRARAKAAPAAEPTPAPRATKTKKIAIAAPVAPVAPALPPPAALPAAVAPPLAEAAPPAPLASVASPAEVPEAEMDEIIRSLRDDVPRDSDAWFHYQALLGDVGVAVARSLVERARALEAQGGMRVETGERQRTLGGIFFALAREQVGPEKWRTLRQLARKRAQAAPPPRAPARPAPEVFVRRRS